ncbi:hypothetical protein Q73A0000_15995 [Kaistella flava (ex Peng et al. 2021)]|uniref:Uncharacterized protein n=1 Tax=Kaistella flava (ex Peng et al. 2021) TaxID=2038776 RepID=A0A7M2YDN3_9FLAO|nr:hypothetical protein [Kaistella flava (ex Peng et al. 2021)]QOW11755.1 hypothetical protein Q73A0000_15995 [Kaistella flava (ex Peng et al. 2021)]
MKKLLLFLAILNFSFVFSQCTITGADQVQVGERQTYSVSDSNVQCTDCYAWTYLDQKVILEDDTHSNTLTLKGSLPGKALLSLEIKTNEGISKCQKSIQVIAPTSKVLDVNAPKCNITTDSFKEVRESDKTVVFEPSDTEKDYSYKWTVTYRSGDKKVSGEKLGKFNFSNENVIDTVELDIVDRECTKKISKSYNNNFWYFF